MGRMYSGKHGKSGSKRPQKKTIPSWVRYKPKEVEMLIVKLAKEKNTPSQIGIILRDTYGVPSVRVLLNKSITQFLDEKKLQGALPEDLLALIKNSIMLKKHLEQNKKDMVAKRGLQLTESKIKRIVKYYKATERLASDWIYDPDKVRLLIE
ncbi:30S ribosomal protein S15 [Candidatus Woesearchaeota archaeon]|nr:30S ribosomal protein S15 [Candidatus Woesearchaeota archaeon]